MDQYLFLFPIEPYIETSCKDSLLFCKKRHHPEELFELINARYRNDGFGINWLLFSKDGNLDEPDLSMVPDYMRFHFQKKDNILKAGISFESHISEKIYADPDYVLNQLPYHEKLVVGGFHQGDCVDRIAECSFGRGVDCFVDEDTTNLFFLKRPRQKIPVKRKKWDLKALGLSGSSTYLIEYVRKSREGKPWLVQV